MEVRVSIITRILQLFPFGLQGWVGIYWNLKDCENVASEVNNLLNGLGPDTCVGDEGMARRIEVEFQ